MKKNLMIAHDQITHPFEEKDKCKICREIMEDEAMKEFECIECQRHLDHCIKCNLEILYPKKRIKWTKEKLKKLINSLKGNDQTSK